MLRSRSRRLVVLGCTAFLAAATPTLVGCASDGPTSGESYVVTLDLDTADAPLLVVNEVGADKEHRYGEARLVGSAEFAGEQVDVELLAIINYLRGNGPFEGFWTFTAENGDRLAFTYSGRAEQRDGAGTLRGEVEVLGGTGRFVNVTGSGTVNGQRSGEFGSGSAISYTINLRLEGLD